MEKKKYLKCYYDSRLYTANDVQQKIEETRLDFPNKIVKVNVSLNEFGVYIITFRFENKDTIFNKIVLKIKKRFNKPLLIDKSYNNYKDYKGYDSNKKYNNYY